MRDSFEVEWEVVVLTMGNMQTAKIDPACFTRTKVKRDASVSVEKYSYIVPVLAQTMSERLGKQSKFEKERRGREEERGRRSREEKVYL